MFSRAMDRAGQSVSTSFIITIVLQCMDVCVDINTYINLDI